MLRSHTNSTVNFSTTSLPLTSQLNVHARPFLPTHETNLNIVFLNVCSLRYKVDEIRDFIASRGIHILGLAETWLDDTVRDGELDIPHFTLYRLDRRCRSGGGVAFYCHNSLKIRRREDLETAFLELLWLELQSRGKYSLLGCAYRAPSKPVSCWQDFSDCITRAIEGAHHSIVIVGDFNIDVASSGNAASVRLESVLTELCPTNFIQDPIRVTASSATTLDLILPSVEPSSECEVVQIDISDHFAVRGTFPVLPNPSRQQPARTTLRRRLHRIDWPVFNLDLSTALASVTDLVDLDELTAAWQTATLSVLDCHAPLKFVRKSDRRPCPCLTDHLVQLVRNRNSSQTPIA